MRFSKYLLFLITCSVCAISSLRAQQDGPAIGQWKSMYCYYGATAAAAGPEKVFCGTSTGFFTLDIEDNITVKYSKVNGMGDAEVSYVAHDPQSGNVLIAYKNSNMDIFKDGVFRNVPDIMVSPIPGDKSINHLLAYHQKAYVASSLGVIVVNLQEGYIDFTTPFYEDASRLPVWSTAIQNGKIYAATTKGLFRINLTDPFIQDYTKWEKISNKPFRKIVASEDAIYGLQLSMSSGASDSVFKINPSGAVTHFYTSTRKIGTIGIGKLKGVWVGENYNPGAGNVTYYNEEGIAGKSYDAFAPTNILETTSGELFFSDYDFTKQYGGLRTPSTGRNTIGHAPDGPESPLSADIWAYNGEVWLAHGGHATNWDFLGNRKAFSAYRNGVWSNFANKVNGFGIEFLSDASTIYKDRNTGIVYIGMAMGGMIEVDKENNVALFQEPYFGTYGTAIIVSGMGQDDKGNMWFSNLGANNPIRAKGIDGNWRSFFPSNATNRNATNLIIDDYGNKWCAMTASGGVFVFSDGGTLDNVFDDKSRSLRVGENNGNLPSNIALSLAKDQDGAIWIGTNNGIAIVENPQETLEKGTPALIKIARFDEEGTGSKLFEGKTVTTIAVDGNNNKWIGTNDAGVWLLNDDATEIIHYFNRNNSPLPHNTITSIDIDPITGDVYISTEAAVVVYRGKAVESSNDYAETLTVYPNPVPSGFEGFIGIKGLKGNTEIRITDITGQLVAQFSTEGGQAVWNGKDYTGRRPQSGVYLIFATDKSTGKTEKAGKLIFHE